jgi:membrane protein YdbS with pleckstrin-like domain
MNIDYMTPEDYEELVEALRICRQPLPLDDEQIRALANRARIREVLRGEVVMKQGEESDALYFVVSGQLRSADTSGDEPNLLNFHAAKAFVGEQGMLYNQPRTATVDAISDSKLAVWDRSAFDWLLGQDDRCRPYFEDLYLHRERRARRPFRGKQWDEVTLVRTGKHIMMLIVALFGPVLLLLFSLGLLLLALALAPELPVVIGVALGVPMFFSLVWGVFNYLNWRDDEYIVTSKRVIHIERFVIYGEKRDEAPLIRIQDVTIVASNFWERVLDFYDLSIQTAGAGTIVFTGMRDAEGTMEVIFEERAKAMERREAGDVAHIRKALAKKMRRTVGDVELPVDTLEPTSGFFAESKSRRLPPLIVPGAVGIDYFCPAGLAT